MLGPVLDPERQPEPIGTADDDDAVRIRAVDGSKPKYVA
jgi:hypothetical protein